jgi:hypothetical protein
MVMKKYLDFKVFYESFFTRLSSENLKYSVVRNYEGLPISKPGGDVDILIEKKNIKDVLNLIRQLIQPFNGRIEITHSFHYVLKLKLHNVLDDKTNKSYTELDLITKLSWYGLNWLSEYEVLNESTLNKKNIYIPSYHHELQMSLFHSLLYGGFVNEKYLKNMNILFSLLDKFKLKKDLNNNFGYHTGDIIFKNIEFSYWQSIEINKFKIRKSLMIVNFNNSISNTFLEVLTNFYCELKVKINNLLVKKI